MGQRARSRLVIVAALAVAAFGIEVAGQRAAPAPDGPPTSPPTGLLAGQVVDAVTGKPVAEASLSVGGGPGATFSYAMGPAGQPNVQGPGRLQSPTGAPRQVLSDSEGRFVFRDLPKGNYVLRVPAAPGYLVGGYGQNRPNGPVQPIALSTDDTKIGDLTIRLWKTSAIGGTVVDETGEPIVGANVQVLRRTAANGIVRLAIASGTSSDDRGIYRMSSLAPGDYLVAVANPLTSMPASTAEAFVQTMGAGGNLANSDIFRSLMTSGGSPGLGGVRVGDFLLSGSGGSMGGAQPVISQDGKLLVYPTTFYPSARLASQATVITLGSGQDRSSIDLQLKLVPSVRISGTVSGPDGPLPNTGVKLYSPDNDSFTGFVSNAESASAVTDGEGAFTFVGVPSGDYTLKVFRVPRPPASNTLPSNITTIEVAGPGGAMMGMGGMMNPGGLPPLPQPIPAEPTLWAAVPVSAGETDVTGLNVALRAGPHLGGRLQFDGSREPPTAAQLQRANVLITSVESRPFAQNPQVRVGADGRFATGGFVPGRYQFAATIAVPPSPGAPPGAAAPWTFKSATLNGRNLADDPLEIGTDDISDIVIAFTDRTTQLTGVVTNQQGQPDPTAEVVAFPADATSWRQGVSNMRRIRDARASPTGQYGFSGLPAGEYFLAAVGGDTPVDLQNPKFLEALVGMATRVTLSDGDKQTRDMQVKALR